MSLTPVGAGLFLAGITYSTRPNHISVKSGDVDIMIVKDAFLSSNGIVAYNAAIRGSSAPDDIITGASADEVVEFVQRKLAPLKMNETSELKKLQDLVRRHVENYGSDVDPRLKAYYDENLS